MTSYEIPKDGIMLSDLPPEGWLIRAEKLREEGCWSEAAKAYQNAGATEPAKECWIKKAEYWRNCNCLKEAANFYEKAGEHQKAMEFLIKHAEECVKYEDWKGASITYAEIDRIEDLL